MILFSSCYYQRIMLANNFYVRGGISEGHTSKDDNIIFSGALIKAYGLERERAIYPRIVIDEEIIEFINSKKENSPFTDLINLFYPILLKDWNVSFINPFGLESACSKILNHPEMNDPEIRGKLDKINTDIQNTNPDIKSDLSDDELIKKLQSDLSEKLEEHSNNYKKYEKYLWLSEFIKWTKNEKSSLNFKYFN